MHKYFLKNQFTPLCKYSADQIKQFSQWSCIMIKSPLIHFEICEGNSCHAAQRSVNTTTYPATTQSINTTVLYLITVSTSLTVIRLHGLWHKVTCSQKVAGFNLVFIVFIVVLFCNISYDIFFIIFQCKFAINFPTFIIPGRTLTALQLFRFQWQNAYCLMQM